MQRRYRRIAGRIGIGRLIGISIVVGVLLGAAGGGFVRARSIEWRSAIATVDTLARWRGKGIAASPLDPLTGEFLPATNPAACRNCSDFERGYAWAERTGVASTAECESYSWSYQRGCIAWLRNGRRIADGRRMAGPGIAIDGD